MCGGEPQQMYRKEEVEVKVRFPGGKSSSEAESEQR